MTAIASPCMKVCTLDSTGRICLGCLRTSDEIAGWAVFSDARRAQIIGILPERYRLLANVEVELEPRKCSRCGISFGCGAKAGENDCWCSRYPPVTPTVGATCLCPACLAAAAN